jgi:hypothetical protein
MERALEPQRSAFRPPTRRSREWRQPCPSEQAEPRGWIEGRVGRGKDRLPRPPASPPRRRSPSPPPRRAPSPPRRRRSPSPVQAVRRRFPSPDPLLSTRGRIIMPTPSTFRPANVQTVVMRNTENTSEMATMIMIDVRGSDFGVVSGRTENLARQMGLRPPRTRSPSPSRDGFAQQRPRSPPRGPRPDRRDDYYPRDR